MKKTGYKTVTRYNLLVKKAERWTKVDTVGDINAAFNWVKRNKAVGNHVRFTQEDIEILKNVNELTSEEVKAIEAECPSCIVFSAVPHFNCSYGGRKMGHSYAHCSADICL